MDNLVLILDVRFTCTYRETETNRSQVDTVASAPSSVSQRTVNSKEKESRVRRGR